MRVLKLGLLSSIALVVFGAAISSEVSGQDQRMIGGGSGITVFVDRNFRGDAATYQGNQSNLNFRFNDRISSVRVGNGEQWQICDQPNYRGQCVNVSGEESDLRQNGWDNRISSFRRMGGGGGGGGGGWNGQTTRPPSWARGTFYSAYPRITLTIDNSGRVTVINAGQSYSGGFNNGRIFLNDDVSTIERWGSGIRTFNQSSGVTTDYSRSANGGDGGDWDGPISNPPSWAVGTFYSTRGDNISLTVTGNGRVTVVNSGQTFYGRYYAGQLYLNNDVSNVSRSGSGINTYNRNSGATTEYSRRRPY